MRKSTSINRLNADNGPFSLWQRAIYRGVNLIDNHIPLIGQTLFKTYHFRVGQIPDEIDMLNDTQASPPRTVCNLFWKHLPWQEIADEVGDLHIFDTGCGSGNYGKHIDTWSNGLMKRYSGIDLHTKENWQTLSQTDARFEFHQSNSTDIRSLIPDSVTCFISQSALEHFDEDITYCRHVANWIRDQKRPIIQVHLMPAAATWHLYLYHGVRQYTPRKINKLMALFADFSSCYLFSLGDAACNDLHREFITAYRGRKGDGRQEDNATYYERLKTAIIDDMQKSEASVPPFYAMVIHSHPNNKIFDQ